ARGLNVRPAGISEQREHAQLVAQRIGAGEMDAVQAERARRLSIASIVVDIDGVRRLDAEALQQQPVDTRIGLDHAFLPRDQYAPEPAQEVEALERKRIGLGGPVGEAVEGYVPKAELGQNLHRAQDRARHHLVEAVAEGVDELRVLRML